MSDLPCGSELIFLNVLFNSVITLFKLKKRQNGPRNQTNYRRYILKATKWLSMILSFEPSEMGDSRSRHNLLPLWKILNWTFAFSKFTGNLKKSYFIKQLFWLRTICFFSLLKRNYDRWNACRIHLKHEQFLQFLGGIKRF